MPRKKSRAVSKSKITATNVDPELLKKKENLLEEFDLQGRIKNLSSFI